MSYMDVLLLYTIADWGMNQPRGDDNDDDWGGTCKLDIFPLFFFYY